MIILALVPAVRGDLARQLAARLEKAVNEGRLAEADECSSALLALVVPESRSELDDDAWFEINKTVRQAISEYAPPYLLDSAECARLTDVLSHESVSTLINIAQSAATSESLLLQLPTNLS